MRRSLCGGIVVLALLALPLVPAAAQETGTPNFKAPYRAFDEHEFGASFSDAEGISGALEGFYTYARGQNDFGVRAGFADPSGEGDTRFLLGGNFRTQVVRYSEDFPLDGALTVGLGGNIGDGDDVFFIPLGISLGRTAGAVAASLFAGGGGYLTGLVLQRRSRTDPTPQVEQEPAE